LPHDAVGPDTRVVLFHGADNDLYIVAEDTPFFAVESQAVDYC